MKKNKSMRLAAVLLVLVLLTTSVIGGTFAKYTSEATGTDTARVAKWSIEVNGEDIAVGQPSIVFDLFNTIKDSNGTDDETDVANMTNDGATVIAPGTSGAFKLEVENTSEVNAEYSIAFEVVSNAKNIPVKFSLTGNDDDWKDDIATLAVADDIDMTENGVDAHEINVFWKWDYEVSAEQNGKDTALGITADDATAPSITVKATITATQVD